MNAVAATFRPNRQGELLQIAEPVPDPTEALIRVHEVALDGTDREILRGEYGSPPPGDDFLIIGHESLGRVVSAPQDSDLAPGDWVTAIVRRPDPVPCPNCAADEWDMCLNGRYTEHGISGAHGFLREYFTEVPKFLVKLPDALAPVGVLVEPLSIVEKAVEQIERIQSRMVWQPRRAVVLGAGPIGLLAALLLRLRGLDTFVYDLAAPGPKSAITEACGASYLWAEQHPIDRALDDIGPVDIVIEATGYSPLAFDGMDLVGPNGIVCLTGVSGGSRNIQIAADHLNKEMVLQNKVVFGTVNSNRRHFEAAVRDLQAIDARWPGLPARLLTRRVPIERYAEAIEPGDDDIKPVVTLATT